MGKDSAIPESHKAPMLLASIYQTCTLESTAAALRTKDASELSWDYVATTLIDEYNAKSTTANLSGSRNGRKKAFESKYFIYIVRSVQSRETEQHYLNIVM